MALRWRFDGPDRYRESLLEATDGADFAPLAGWDYVRAATLAPEPAGAPRRPPDPPGPLRAFEPLLDPAWEAEARGLRIRSSFEWMPYVEVVRARVVAPVEDGEADRLLDAYVYRHPTEDTLRCLALTLRGGVHEGLVTVLPTGALRLELEGHDGDRAVRQVVRLDVEGESLRTLIWSMDGGERRLRLDVHHERVQAGD